MEDKDLYTIAKEYGEVSPAMSLTQGLGIFHTVTL